MFIGCSPALNVTWSVLSSVWSWGQDQVKGRSAPHGRSLHGVLLLLTSLNNFYHAPAHSWMQDAILHEVVLVVNVIFRPSASLVSDTSILCRSGWVELLATFDHWCNKHGRQVPLMSQRRLVQYIDDDDVLLYINTTCWVFPTNVHFTFFVIHSFIHIRLFSVVKTQPNMN